MPGLGQQERIRTGVARECTGEIGERRHHVAFRGDPTLDHPIGQPQREGGIREHAGAVFGETCLRDQFGVLVLDRFDIVFIALAQRARFRIDLFGEHDKWIGRRIDRGLAAIPQRLAHLGIAEFGAGDHALGDRIGRFLAQCFTHERIVRAQPFAQLGQRPAQCRLFQLRIHRRFGEQALGDARQRRFGVFAQTLTIRFVALGGPAHQQPRVAEIIRVEAATPFDETIAGIELAILGFGLRDRIPRTAESGLAHLVGIDEAAQIGFLLALEREHFRILERFEFTLECLETVLDAEAVVLAGARFLFAQHGVLVEHAAQFR